MYRLLRNILFLFPAEWVHYFSMNCLKALCRVGLVKKNITRAFTPPDDQYELFNLLFPNRVGLGAGFDKNAKYLRELECLGFGFVEIGTVTPLPQAGNDKPRLFRLKKDNALVNRMGFNNDGAKAVAERLKNWRAGYQSSKIQNGKSEIENRKSEIGNPRLIIGGNIGKNKITTNENAWKDYEMCFSALHSYVDYFVVNVSSPNTPGLRDLQEKPALRKILVHLQRINNEKPSLKPILLKISPDLTLAQVDDVIALAVEIKLDGIVATNTTISRAGLTTHHSKLQAIGSGGLSGLPLKHSSTEFVKYICEKTRGQVPVIASGGIFTGADAKEKIEAGAALIQVWTGFIYEGPGIVKRICQSL